MPGKYIAIATPLQAEFNPMAKSWIYLHRLNMLLFRVFGWQLFFLWKDGSTS